MPDSHISGGNTVAIHVKSLCLGVLTLGEASGYEIKKEIEEGLFAHFIDASFGSIYPALTQLHAEGLVTVRAEEQTGRPDKKVYALTEAGRQALAKSVTVLPGKDKYRSEFLFQMLMGELVGTGQKLEAIDRQLSFLREDLTSIDQCNCAAMPLAGAQFVAEYGRAVLTAAVTHLEQKRAEMLGQHRPQAAE